MAPGTVIITASVVYAGLVLVMVTLTRHFAAPQTLSVTAERLAELSVDATNLLRLLDEERFQSFRTQPGITPKMANRLRIRQCQLCHERFRRLDNDFKLVCMALKVIIVESKQDRPDLAWTLVRNEMTFAYGMMMVRFQLVRYRYGL